MPYQRTLTQESKKEPYQKTRYQEAKKKKNFIIKLYQKSKKVSYEKRHLIKKP